MPVLRKLPDNTLLLIDIPPENELDFYNMNQASGEYILVDTLPESRFGFYKWDPTTNTVVVDTAKELEAYKQRKIADLDEHTRDYILTHYPLEKQNSDDQQKDYYGTALLLIRNNDTDPNTPNLTIDDLYQTIATHVNSILDNGVLLSDIISTYPPAEQYYWEQLIKGACRKAWVVRCVYVFNQILSQIQNATTIDELDNINTQLPDFPPFPEF